MKNKIIGLLIIGLLGSIIFFSLKGPNDEDLSEVENESDETSASNFWPGEEENENEDSLKSDSIKTTSKDEETYDMSGDEEEVSPRFASKKDKQEEKKKNKKEEINLEKMLSIIDERFRDDDEKMLLRDSVETFASISRLPTKLTPMDNGGSDPLDKKPTNSISEGSSSNPSGQPSSPVNDQLDLSIYGVSSKDKEDYVAGEEKVDLFFEAYNKDKNIAANAKAEVFNNNKELVATLAYTETTPNKYKATIENPYLITSKPEGTYFVKVQATTKVASGLTKTINVVDSFSINTKKSRYGGSIVDMLDKEGNLRFDVAYRVYVSGTYLIQASLYDNNGKMIAFYEEPINLERSSKVLIPLEFHGNFFYQRKLSGPFYLKNISLSYVNSDLTNETGGVNTVNFQTKNYQWSEFNSSSYVNTEMMDKIKGIENYLNSILASSN